MSDEDRLVAGIENWIKNPRSRETNLLKVWPWQAGPIKVAGLLPKIRSWAEDAGCDILELGFGLQVIARRR